MPKRKHTLVESLGLPKKGHLYYVKGKSVYEIGKKQAVAKGLDFDRDDYEYLYFVKKGSLYKVRRKKA